MRLFLAVLILGATVSATVSACGAGGGGRSHSPPDAATAASRIERCVDRLVPESTTQNAADQQAVRRYARQTYCARFEQRGWVYDDGAVSIAAQTWLDNGATCEKGSAGQPARTVPCTLAGPSGGVQMLDCAILHIVRRSEVREYIDRLSANGSVKCDDGTVLHELGVP